MLVDSHCHLDFPQLQADLPGVLARMRDHGVMHALTISTTLGTFPAVLAVAKGHAHVWCSAGVHPDEQADGREVTLEELVRMAQDERVVAIGETGLDYFRVEGDTAWQRERFRIHIRAARSLGKPLVIHTREAAADTLRILEEEGAPERVVFHCYSGDAAMAKICAERGYVMSFAGPVTFKANDALREALRVAPLDLVLVETDAPFLTPMPYRGRPNAPYLIPLTVRSMAQTRGMDVAELCAAIDANTRRVFALR